jgi:hypothetical protein
MKFKRDLADLREAASVEFPPSLRLAYRARVSVGHRSPGRRCKSGLRQSEMGRKKVLFKEDMSTSLSP